MTANRTVLAFALLLALGACRGRGEGDGESASVFDALPPAPRTTSPEIALGNLEAEIRGLEARLAEGRLTPLQLAALAGLYDLAGQVHGRISAYERALALAERMVAELPQAPQGYLARARARSRLHRYDQAAADLDRALSLGSGSGETEGTRAAILCAVGRSEEGLKLARARAAGAPSTTTHGAMAALLAEAGDRDGATASFAKARAAYRDVSPFPLVWLDFQEGRMLLEAGETERARELLARAHARLPEDVASATHLAEALAELGRAEEAVAMLNPLAETAEDPDPAASLARVLTGMGEREDAARWTAFAARRYDEVTARHPEAYADHAAEFWLDPGGDPARAVELAALNRRVRDTAAARDLLARATAASQVARVD